MPERGSYDAYIDGVHGDFLAALARAVSLADTGAKSAIGVHWPEVVAAYDWPDHEQAPVDYDREIRRQIGLES